MPVVCDDLCIFFFFTQKTAYEMRISDWSSDVCSSDLVGAILTAHAGTAPSERTLQRLFVRLELTTRPDGMAPRAFGRFEAAAPNERWTGEIGRASCRERVCQYV